MESDLPILGVETVCPVEVERRERIHCEVSNCSRSFDNSLQYVKHLNDHKNQVELSYRKIKTILEDKNDVTAASVDLVCSSCLKPAVTANNGNSSETSLELLEQHKAECSQRLEEFRKKETSKERYSPMCEDGCEDCIGPKMCSKTHEVSLSDLNCETVLEFLEKKNWQICPSCLTVETENLPFHFIIGHPEITDIAGNTYKALKPGIK